MFKAEQGGIPVPGTINNIKESFIVDNLKISIGMGTYDANPFEREIDISVNSGEKNLDLKDLLPKGWRFFETQMGGAWTSPDKKTITIPKYSPIPASVLEKINQDPSTLLRNESEGKIYEGRLFLKTRGSLIILLHEVGHAFQNEDEERKAKKGQIMELMRSKALEEMDDSELEQCADYFIERERNANMFALKKLRELRRQGVDLAPGLSTKDIFQISGENGIGHYGFSKEQSDQFTTNFKKKLRK